MKKYNNNGIAIFIALMLLFLLSLIVIVALLAAYNYNNICEGQIRRLKALASAEAGINYAYWQLRPPTTFVADHGSEATADTSLSGINTGVTPVKIWVTGPDSNSRYTIKSKAEYQKTTIP